MLKLMILCLMIYKTATDQGYNYNPQEEISLFNNLRPIKETEFLTYTAPEDENDIKDAKQFANLLQPQRVIFIKSPENKLFSLTAEQLTKQQSVNIYVLQRQLDYADQLQEARDRVNYQPNVQFIKYKTSADIERAQEAIYKDFENLPGSLRYYQNHQTPVYKFDNRSRELISLQQQNDTQNSVIFEILKRPTSPPSVDLSTKESINSENINESIDSTNVTDYLPPKQN